MTVKPSAFLRSATMDRVAVIGVTLNETDVAGLEGVVRPEPDAVEMFQRELADALAVSELVFLSTCNRVEVIFARENGHLPNRGDLDAAQRILRVGDDEARRTDFVLWTGRAAARPYSAQWFPGTLDKAAPSWSDE